MVKSCFRQPGPPVDWGGAGVGPNRKQSPCSELKGKPLWGRRIEGAGIGLVADTPSPRLPPDWDLLHTVQANGLGGFTGPEKDSPTPSLLMRLKQSICGETSGDHSIPPSMSRSLGTVDICVAPGWHLQPAFTPVSVSPWGFQSGHRTQIAKVPQPPPQRHLISTSPATSSGREISQPLHQVQRETLKLFLMALRGRRNDLVGKGALSQCDDLNFISGTHIRGAGEN